MVIPFPRHIQIVKESTMQYLGPLKFSLGKEFLQEKGLVQMTQTKYCISILERFGMMDCNPVKIHCEPHIHDLMRQNKYSHIEIKHEHVRDHVLKVTFGLTHVPSQSHAADGFTKPPCIYFLLSKFKAHCAKSIQKFP